MICLTLAQPPVRVRGPVRGQHDGGVEEVGQEVSALRRGQGQGAGGALQAGAGRVVDVLAECVVVLVAAVHQHVPGDPGGLRDPRRRLAAVAGEQAAAVVHLDQGGRAGDHVRGGQERVVLRLLPPGQRVAAGHELRGAAVGPPAAGVAGLGARAVLRRLADQVELLHPRDDLLPVAVEALPPGHQRVADAAVGFLGGGLVGGHPLEFLVDLVLLVDDLVEGCHYHPPFRAEMPASRHICSVRITRSR